MNKKACFTGHRPQKLPWGFDEQDIRCIELKNRIKSATEKAIQNGYDYFISGMALGCDIYFSEIVLELQQQYQHIKLECAIPYKAQASAWNIQQREHYFEIIEKSDKETLLSYSYYHGCLIARNKYMVDNSSMLIAAYIENEKGGAKRTMQYAQKSGLEIIHLLI